MFFRKSTKKRSMHCFQRTEISVSVHTDGRKTPALNPVPAACSPPAPSGSASLSAKARVCMQQQQRMVSAWFSGLNCLKLDKGPCVGEGRCLVKLWAAGKEHSEN